MAPIMTTVLKTLVKAGANVSSVMTANTTGQVDQFIAEAESYVNAVTRINYSDSYSGLNIDTKTILDDVVSSKAAMFCISFDMSGYTSRFEAETMLDVLDDAVLKGISLIKDKKQTDFIDDA